MKQFFADQLMFKPLSTENLVGRYEIEKIRFFAVITRFIIYQMGLFDGISIIPAYFFEFCGARSFSNK